MLRKIGIVLVLLCSTVAYAQFSKSTLNSSTSAQFPDNVTGQITPATTRAYLNSIIASFQQYAGLNKRVGAAYTIAPSDYGQLVTFANPSQVAVTLTDASVIGTFNFYVQNVSTGNVVITPQVGTIGGAAALTLANQQSAWIISDGTNWQVVYGLGGTLISNPLAVANGGTAVTFANGLALDNITGFTPTGFIIRNGAASYSFLSTTNGLTLGNIGQIPPKTILGNSSPTSPANVNALTAGQAGSVLCIPAPHTFLTASGTFATDTCNGVLATWLEVHLQGGGGGGAGSGTNATTGTAGNNSTFGALTAGGGGAGQGGGTTSGGTGGTCTGSLAITQQNITGGVGFGPTVALAANAPGGAGAASPYGGAGAPGISGAVGGNAVANTGSGGAGGSSNTTANVFAGAGGGAGCHIYAIVSPPALTYAYSIGAGVNGGVAGTSGVAAGNGGSGFLSVISHWQ